MGELLNIIEDGLNKQVIEYKICKIKLEKKKKWKIIKCN